MDCKTYSIAAVLKDYAILMEIMEEIKFTTHDEYGMKAGGIIIRAATNTNF